MASKKDRLLQRVRERAPRREENLLKVEEDKKLSYRVVSASLYTPQADYIDEITRILRSAGIPRANRSLVLQQLVTLGEEQLGKSPAAVVAFFRKRLASRLAGSEPTS